MFIAYQVTLDAIRLLPPIVAAIKRHNPDLADQLMRAGQNTLLNLAEARRRTGKDRRNRDRIYAGEAAECVAALDVALAWSLADAAACQEARRLFDRSLGLTWKMCRPQQ